VEGGFRALEVYRRASRLSDELRNVALSWPPFDRWTVGVQLVRAGDSIGANLAEGSGRFAPLDQRRLFVMARGSACELEHWLDRASARSLDIPTAAPKESKEISRMLSALVRNIPQH
jgi:four helix bundle protein